MRRESLTSSLDSLRLVKQVCGSSNPTPRNTLVGLGAGDALEPWAWKAACAQADLEPCGPHSFPQVKYRFVVPPGGLEPLTPG
jgi:hypothetical protein